jgi:hypothetical protein
MPWHAPAVNEPQPPMRYGGALLLIVVAIIATAFSEDEGWPAMLALLAQGGALIFILETSGARRVVRTIAYVATAIGVLTGIAGIVAGGETSTWSLVVVGALLALAAPLAIIRRLTRVSEVTASAVAGALCLYLLLGQFFTFVYRSIDAIAASRFFTQTGAASAVDFTFFSFVTLTTVGYGDLTPALDLGRMLAVSEALIGQIYLVTVVALAVSRIGQQRAGLRPSE